MSWLRFATVTGLAVCLASCATRGVIFDGHAEPRMTRAADLDELENLPEGYERLGRVMARCTLVEGEQPKTGARLVDVDCTQSRLRAAMRERAADVGGAALIERRCRSRITSQNETSTTLAISCDADVARPTGETLAKRPLVAGVMAEDDVPRADEAWHIRVLFTPAPGVIYQAPRRADRVREVPHMPAANFRLGDIVTHCHEGCTRDGVRLGLMAAAGRMGASDVVDLTCVAKGKGYMCSAIATAQEADSELDPNAR